MSMAKRFISWVSICALACAMAACFATVQPAYADQQFEQSKLGYQVFPVQLQKGVVKIDFMSGASSADCGIYAAADESGASSGTVVSCYTSGAYGTGSKWGVVNATGTYYVRFYASKYNGAIGSQLVIREYPYVYERSISFGAVGWTTSMADNKTYSYFKIKAPSRGYITFAVKNAEENSSGYAYTNLCNSSKKAYYSNDSRVKDGESAFYAVKAGTYYIRVKSYDTLYGYAASFTKVGAKPGAKKPKATKLTLGKTKGAVIVPGEKAGWYKVTLKKAKKCTLTVRTATTYYGGVKVTVSGKGYYDETMYITNSEGKKFKTKKLKKGTYYVKVEPYNKGHAYYTIRWK